MTGGVDPSMATEATSESVLVVNDREGIADWLRRRHPTWHVKTCDTFLSAIAEITGEPFHTVMAYVDPWQQELEKAVAGLREAAGDGARLLLCCRPEAEPIVLRVMANGADDYLICPLRDEEVIAALASSHSLNTDAEASPPAGATMEGTRAPAAPVWNGPDAPSVEAEATAELAALGEAVDRLGSPPEQLLDALAEYLRVSMGAGAARVVVEGSMGRAGDTGSEPELVEPLYRDNTPIGHAAVWPKKQGSFDATEVSNLGHYAKVVVRLALAALERRRLREMAYTDELSGLPNRRYLRECLARLIEQAREDGSTVTLLMFDIDDFKSYNDAHGHEAGDEIIKGCGALFRRNVRDHDVVTRYGGDEFAVIFWDKEGPRIPGSEHPRELLPLIQRFRRSLRAHRFRHLELPRRVRLTISGGLASFPRDASSPDDLVRQADAALLAAKREGKNCIYIGGENGGRALGARRSG